jgi:hypothetical protein
MSQIAPNELEQFDGDDLPRNEMLHSSRTRRRHTTTASKMRARRSRTNEMARRGMHQRRNKRTSW